MLYKSHGFFTRSGKDYYPLIQIRYMANRSSDALSFKNRGSPLRLNFNFNFNKCQLIRFSHKISENSLSLEQNKSQRKIKKIQIG